MKGVETIVVRIDVRLLAKIDAWALEELGKDKRNTLITRELARTVLVEDAERHDRGLEELAHDQLKEAKPEKRPGEQDQLV